MERRRVGGPLAQHGWRGEKNAFKIAHVLVALVQEKLWRKRPILCRSAVSRLFRYPGPYLDQIFQTQKMFPPFFFAGESREVLLGAVDCRPRQLQGQL